MWKTLLVYWCRYMEVKGVVAQTTELKRCPIIPLHLTTTTHSGVDPLERIVWKDHLVLLPRVGKILVLDCHHSDDPMGPWVEWELPVGWIIRWRAIFYVNALDEVCLETHLDDGKNIWCRRNVGIQDKWHPVDPTLLNFQTGARSLLLGTLPADIVERCFPIGYKIFVVYVFNRHVLLNRWDIKGFT